MKKDFYTLDELQTELNVTQRTLYRYIKRGILTAEKVDGYRYYVTAADLKAFTTGKTSKGKTTRQVKGVQLPTKEERQRMEREARRKGATV